jgi:SAM-dependent methyltransferase
VKKSEYEKKKSREKEWYKRNKNKKQRLITRILRHPLLFNPKRNAFNYIFPKKQMTEILRRHLKKKADKLLIAPCGTGDDYQYLKDIAKKHYGIDLSPVAIKKCPKQINTKAKDILKSGYANNTFDIIVSPLFFHHLLQIGFDSFLKEFHRTLKKGGQLVILEPSIWYPLNIITRPMKKIFRNPYGEVEDEGPFRPKLLIDALKRTEFTDIEVQAATFSHCSFYVPFARFFNWTTKPLLKVWPFKYFGWIVVYWARKK